MKHIIKWLSCPTVFGLVDIDMQCQHIPPNHNITLFTKGITILSYLSEKKHKDIYYILLRLIIDLFLSDGLVSSCIIKAVHALLDFLYLA